MLNLRIVPAKKLRKITLTAQKLKIKRKIISEFKDMAQHGHIEIALSGILPEIYLELEKKGYTITMDERMGYKYFIISWENAK